MNTFTRNRSGVLAPFEIPRVEWLRAAPVETTAGLFCPFRITDTVVQHHIHAVSIHCQQKCTGNCLDGNWARFGGEAHSGTLVRQHAISYCSQNCKIRTQNPLITFSNSDSQTFPESSTTSEVRTQDTASNPDDLTDKFPIFWRKEQRWIIRTLAS